MNTSPALRGFEFAAQLSAKTTEWHAKGIKDGATLGDKFVGQLGSRVCNLFNAPAAAIDAITYFSLGIITAASANWVVGFAFDAIAPKLGSTVTHQQLNLSDAGTLFRRSLEAVVVAVALPALGFIHPQNTLALLRSVQFTPETINAGKEKDTDSVVNVKELQGELKETQEALKKEKEENATLKISMNAMDRTLSEERHRRVFEARQYDELNQKYSALQERNESLDQDYKNAVARGKKETTEVAKVYKEERESHRETKKNYDALRENHHDLEITHETLKKEHDALRENHDDLEMTHETLKKAHDALRENHDDLEMTHETLKKAHETAIKKHSCIREKYKNLKKEAGKVQEKVEEAVSHQHHHHDNPHSAEGQ